jgi:hypothetical protein
MRGNKWSMLAGAFTAILLIALEAAPAELTSDQTSNEWVQSYGRHNKDCLEWNDICVNCVRAQSGDDYSCSNVGIACQPKEVRCVRRADKKQGDCRRKLLAARSVAPYVKDQLTSANPLASFIERVEVIGERFVDRSKNRSHS